jgi:hypothetical protein
MEAFEEMGVSVFSGMATSFMAAFVLLFCQIRFFYKFGVFLAMTITFSWLWANFFFMGVMATVGPQAKTATSDDGAVKDVELETVLVAPSVVEAASDDISVEPVVDAPVAVVDVSPSAAV